MRWIDTISHQICVFSWMHPHFPIVGDFGIFRSGFGTVQVGPVVRVDYNIPETFFAPLMSHEERCLSVQG